MITLQDLETNDEVMRLIKHSGDILSVMEYTEHGLRHAKYVSRVAGKVLEMLCYSERECELAKIAGFTHDVGNTVNRLNHGVSGALLMYPILRDMGMDTDELHIIMSAIGNHEEEIGTVINVVSAALVIADKSDAHRTRVKRHQFSNSDIHDRVNFSIKKNFVAIDGEKKRIASKYYMDDTASVMDFLSIYLKRIIMSEKAAKFLGCSFRLYINDVLINTAVKYSLDKIRKIQEDGSEV